jgi:glycosyltransferase involved in cell wall biosynthesis
MKTMLVNALSVTNQSGLHVLAGHLDQMVDRLRPRMRFAVVCRSRMNELKTRFEGRVDWIEAPLRTARWLPRAIWEAGHLRKIADACAAQVYFTPSGMASPSLEIPQVVLCQNPWAMVSSARQGSDALKAWLQRRAYRDAMRRADVMVFNSSFMQDLYRQNAGFQERRGRVVHQAVDEASRRRAEAWRGRPRNPGQMLCVSAMAPHKNVETLVKALARIVDGSSGSLPSVPDVSLHLVGAWPDPRYETKIRTLVATLRLEASVHVHGFVSREELDRLYAESQVFCLMSRCESFGIPAIEAQLFGTPVVSSKACAIPEICGDGGLFCDPDDIAGIAFALRALLAGGSRWQTLSGRARLNAARFRWETCSRPLVELFEAEGGI